LKFAENFKGTNTGGKKMMNKTRLCFISVLAILVLLPLSLSATGGGAGAQPKDFMEITWEGRIASGEETTYAQGIIEELFNVKITPNGVAANDDTEKVKLMVSTGEFPDVGCYWLDKWELYEEGAIRSFSKKMIEENMPNYLKLLEENPIGWLLNKPQDKEDEYISINGISPNTHSNYWAISFRKDWCDNVGFDIPKWDETKKPLDNIGRSYWYNEDISLADWERMLVLFKNEDPDGDGKDDTIPWGGWGRANDNADRWMWSCLDGAHNFNMSWSNECVDGKVYDMVICPQYRNFLRTVQRWWSKGLIDKEYLNISLAKAWEKCGGEHSVAMMPHMISYACKDDDSLNRPSSNLANMEEVAAGAEVVVMAGPTGPEGTKGAAAYRQIHSMNGYHLFIGGHVDDEKCARIMQILDWMYGPDENWIAYFRGKEGVHFDWAGEPFQSQMIKRKAEDVPEGYPKQGNFHTGYPVVYTESHYKFMYTPKYVDHLLNFMLAPAGQKIAFRKCKADIFNQTNLAAVNIEYGETLTTIHEEYELRFIMGELDLDKDWDNYVKTWLDAGGQEMMDELQKAPLVSGLLKGKMEY